MFPKGNLFMKSSVFLLDHLERVIKRNSRTCIRTCRFVSTNASYADSTYQGKGKDTHFSPKKILLLRKTTRYEYEKQLKNSTNEDTLKDYVSI